jgi:integrase
MCSAVSRGPALDAAAPMSTRMSSGTKRGLPIRGRSPHYSSWNSVRAAFLGGATRAPPARAIVDLDWHSLRHFCGWYFYVHMGFSDELTASQLGHADAKLLLDLLRDRRADALARLKRSARVEVR